jgi:hypothetical protein
VNGPVRNDHIDMSKSTPPELPCSPTSEVNAKKNIELPVSVFTTNHEEWSLLAVNLECCINVECFLDSGGSGGSGCVCPKHCTVIVGWWGNPMASAGIVDVFKHCLYPSLLAVLHPLSNFDIQTVPLPRLVPVAKCSQAGQVLT